MDVAKRVDAAMFCLARGEFAFMLPCDLDLHRPLARKHEGCAAAVPGGKLTVMIAR